MAVTIAQQYTLRTFWWTDWKVQQLKRRGIFQFDESDETYFVWFYDGPEAFMATIWRGQLPQTQINSGYSQAQNDLDLSDFESDWKVDGNKTLDAHESDGRAVVAAYPAYMGTQTQFTSRGDDMATGTPNTGPRMKFNFTGPDTKSVDVQFLTPVQLADGAAVFSGAWDVSEDSISFSVEIGATATTTNPTNTGNCNLVDMGGYNMIVPAAGDGTHDVDLAVAKPIIPDIDGGTLPWWVDLYTGATTPSARGDGNAILLDVPQSSLFINCCPIGAADGHWDIEVYRAEYIHQSWVLRGTVTKQSAGAGLLAGELLIYRIGPK